MNSKQFFCLLSLTLGTLGLAWPAPVRQRGEPDQVRDVFVETRAKAPSAKGRAHPAHPRQQPPVPRSARFIGLGYTLLQRDANGNPVRVSAAQEFQ